MNPNHKRCNSSAGTDRHYYVEVSATVVANGDTIHECIGEMGPYRSPTDAIIAGCCAIGRRVRDMLREPHTIAYCTQPGADHGHARVDQYSVHRCRADLGHADQRAISGALHTVDGPTSHRSSQVDARKSFLMTVYTDTGSDGTYLQHSRTVRNTPSPSHSPCSTLSPADTEVDDPTIRPRIGFAASPEVVNLYGYRHYRPCRIAQSPRFGGQENTIHLRVATSTPAARIRRLGHTRTTRRVAGIPTMPGANNLPCLGTNQDGSPRLHSPGGEIEVAPPGPGLRLF